MLNFIVLGILPGTSLIITLTWVLVTVLVLTISGVIWYELHRTKEDTKSKTKSKVRYSKTSTV